MKKLITICALILVIALCSFTTHFFTWASLASNQHISLNNLQDAVDNGVFNLKYPIPSGNRRITKADAAFYVYLNEYYSPFASKSSTQHVTKGDLQPNGTYTIHVFGTVGTGCVDANLYLTSSAAVPCDASLTFEWCADNGATGTETLTIPSGQTSVMITVNTSAYGGSGCVGTDVRVKPSRISFSNTCSPDPYTWLITSDSWDNGCNYSLPASSQVICVKGCPIIPEVRP
jgi:hypothetical protein